MLHKGFNIETILQAFVGALIFSVDEENRDLAQDLSIEDFAPEETEALKAKIIAFIDLANDVLQDSDYHHNDPQIGHDLLFTANGDGVGFWEADHCTKEQGERLTDACCKVFKPYYLLFDDDEKAFMASM